MSRTVRRHTGALNDAAEALEALALHQRGLSVRKIGKRLNRGERTVKRLLHQARALLGAYDSRARAEFLVRQPRRALPWVQEIVNGRGRDTLTLTDQVREILKDPAEDLRSARLRFEEALARARFRVEDRTHYTSQEARDRKARRRKQGLRQRVTALRAGVT